MTRNVAHVKHEGPLTAVQTMLLEVNTESDPDTLPTNKVWHYDHYDIPKEVEKIAQALAAEGQETWDSFRGGGDEEVNERFKTFDWWLHDHFDDF